MSCWPFPTDSLCPVSCRPFPANAWVFMAVPAFAPAKSLEQSCLNGGFQVRIGQHTVRASDIIDELPEGHTVSICLILCIWDYVCLPCLGSASLSVSQK